ncbi:MAG: response regulator [Desulfobacterales bacterium]
MRGSILLAVDDKPDNLFVIRQIITEYCSGFTVLTAPDAASGLSLASRSLPDVALIDVQMPGMDGIEMCRRLKTDPKTAHIPVILLTAHRASPALKVTGLEAGADDFISKPVDGVELSARIRVMLRIKKAEDRLRQERESLRATVTEQNGQLQDIEKRYKILFDNVNDGILVRSFEGHILDINRVNCQRLGYSREELLRMNVAEIISPESAEELADRTRRLGERGSLVYELFHKRRDGIIFPVESNSRVIEYEGRQMILTVSRDISERKQAEAEKNFLQAQLQQSQKHEAIGTLAGGIAHDFNNILFPIIGYTEMTMDEIPEDSPAYSNLYEILRASRRAAQLVQHILTFSRSTEQERKPLRMQVIVKEALKLIRAAIPQTISIHQDIDSNCGPVLADPTQIHQIVMNLCTNAYHAMQEKGGELRVSLCEVSIAPEDHAGDLNKRPGPYVRMMISDTGCGMDKSVMDHIFDPYFTTKPPGKGTGMGLAVVHGIVKSCGGEITVYSKPGTGSAFYVYLPRTCTEGEEILPDSAGAVPGGRERILLVDDEDQIVTMEKRILESLGYQVTAETGSLEALEIFRRNPEDFDLVITDQAMPKMAGSQLAENLMRIQPGIPIILCTGFSETFTEKDAGKLGIREFVLKPIVKKELAQTIRRVLDGGTGDISL